MRLSDLKRAVEDVVLRPDENPLSDLPNRSTLAALDLCQVEKSVQESCIDDNQRPMTSSSYSGDVLASSSSATSTTSVNTSAGLIYIEQPLLMSTSLDTVVLRKSVPSRPSFGASRRSSRFLPHLSSGKRKRSNSVSSCISKRLVTHGGVPSDVSCTTTGCASALSLPPTVRPTPFCYGDSEDQWMIAEGSSDANILHFDASPSRSDHLKSMEREIMKFPQSEQKIDICDRVVNEKSCSFSTFRVPLNIYDSDNDEKMDCD